MADEIHSRKVAVLSIAEVSGDQVRVSVRDIAAASVNSGRGPAGVPGGNQIYSVDIDKPTDAFSPGEELELVLYRGSRE